MEALSYATLAIEPSEITIEAKCPNHITLTCVLLAPISNLIMTFSTKSFKISKSVLP